MTWLTKDMNGKPLCNFTLNVLGVDEVRFNGVGERIQWVKVCIDFGEKDIANQMILAIPLEEIYKTCWKDLNTCCRYNPEVSESKVKRYLEDIIRDQIKKVPRRLVEHLTHTGMHNLDDHLVFCTGKSIIQDSAKETGHIIEIASLEENLDVDDELKECDAAKEMIDFISLSPEAGQIILSYKLGYFMRMAYEKIGKMPRGCIYLHGDTGIQKTTFSSFLTQTYNRSNGIKSPSRLSASIPAAVQILKEEADDVVILDDLFPAESGKIRGQMEETLIEIVRYIADGTLPERMHGNKLLQASPKCGVIFTAERIIGKGSDAARILPVEMVKPDVRELQYFQDHPLIISTFYYQYISWFIEHYDEICEIINRIWKVYENADMGVHDRLREMHFFLSSAYFLFLQYCFEKGVLSQSDADRLYQTFNKLLIMLVEQQNERVSGKGTEKFENEDYLQQIRMLYKTGQMSIAKNTETFDKEQHDGLLYRNRLCLRRDRLSAYFPDSTIGDIADSLEAQGALETGKKSRTKQINRLSGMRFYFILLHYLN